MTAPDPETRLRTLLERVPDTPPPVDAVVAAGERGRRARRARLAGAGAAAAVVVVALASLVVGRPGEPTPAVDPGHDRFALVGTWEVVELRDADGQGVRLTGLPRPVRVEFERVDDTFSGTDGCNVFSGRQRGRGEDYTMNVRLTSQAGCRPSMVLVDRLRDVAQVQESAGGLVLADAAGDPVLTLAKALPPLTGRWEVTSIAAVDGLPAYDADETSWTKPVVVHFDPDPGAGERITGARPGDGVVWATTGCNGTGGAYLQRGAALRSRQRTLSTSLAACPGEPAIYSLLDDMRLATLLDGRTLLLRDGDGRVLADLRRAD